VREESRGGLSFRDRGERGHLGAIVRAEVQEGGPRAPKESEAITSRGVRRKDDSFSLVTGAFK